MKWNRAGRQDKNHTIPYLRYLQLGRKEFKFKMYQFTNHEGEKVQEIHLKRTGAGILGPGALCADATEAGAVSPEEPKWCCVASMLPSLRPLSFPCDPSQPTAPHPQPLNGTHTSCGFPLFL